MGIDISCIRISELVLTTKKEDGNIRDRFACGVYLRAAFISLAVDIGGGVYLRMAFIQGRCLIFLYGCLYSLSAHQKGNGCPFKGGCHG